MRLAPPWARPARAWSLDGRVLPVACPPVLDLLPMLTHPDNPSIYLVLATLTRPADVAWVAGQIVAPYPAPIDDELCDAIADELVFSWCGVERWLAARLWTEALGAWVYFEGPLTARGVDIGALSAAVATRLVWSTLAQRHSQDKDKGDGWKRRLEAPPLPPRGPAALPGRRAKPTPAELAADSASFENAFSRVGGRG